MFYDEEAELQEINLDPNSRRKPLPSMQRAVEQNEEIAKQRAMSGMMNEFGEYEDPMDEAHLQAAGSGGLGQFSSMPFWKRKKGGGGGGMGGMMGGGGGGMDISSLLGMLGG